MSDTITNAQGTLIERFQTGIRLSTNAEYDRANSLLLECVTADPGNLEFAEGFLANLARKFRSANEARAPDGGQNAELKRAWAEKNWTKLLRLGPEQLSSNPRHVPTLRAMAEANAARGDYDVERCYLKLALENAPQDVELNRQGGTSAVRLRKFDEALECWRRVEESCPEDGEAARMIATLTVARSRQRVGWASPSDESAAVDASRQERPKPAQTPRPAIRFDKEQWSHESLRPSFDLKRTPIQQLELAIREYPSHVDLYLQLAPLYLEQGRDYDAERLLAKAREATDDDARVRHVWEDVMMLRLDKKVALARKRIEVDQTDEAREELADLVSKRDRMDTDVFVERCKREPDNAELRYQLGLRLKRAGNLREAYQSFEEALADPEQKCVAAYELGECRQQSGEFPEAFRYYRLAAEAATGPTQLESKKQALYRAGALAQQIKLGALAQRYWADLLRIDPHFKDAAVLMRDLKRSVE